MQEMKCNSATNDNRYYGSYRISNPCNHHGQHHVGSMVAGNTIETSILKE
jgi:hypothetical protein